jgi:hypothetical protein
VLGVVVAEGVALLLLGVLVLGLLRSHALILKALHELGAGLELEKQSAGTTRSDLRLQDGPASSQRAPSNFVDGVVANGRPATTQAHDIVGTTLTGATSSVTVECGRTLLAFLTSGCSVCQTFWDHFAADPSDVPGNGALTVVAKGPEEESPSALRRLAGTDLTVLQSSAAWTDYGIPGSPYFVYVEDGVITGEGSATTWPQVRDLMAQAVADSGEARRSAGRTGPGALIGDALGRSERDSAPDKDSAPDRDSVPRIDAELIAAGIRPGDPSLYEPPPPPEADRHRNDGA